MFSPGHFNRFFVSYVFFLFFSCYLPLEVLVSDVVELRLGGFESSSRGSEISRESRFLWEVLLRREKLSWLRYSGSVYKHSKD